MLFTTPKADLKKNGNGNGAGRVLAFPYGGKVDAENISYAFGGGGANVSASLASLGVPVSVITRVGKDWRGKEVIKNLRSFGVDVRQVQRDPRETTALAFIVTTGGARDHVAFVARAATKKLIVPTKLSRAYSWAYVTALATDDWFRRTRALFRNLRTADQHVFWNPGMRQILEPKKIKVLLPFVSVLDVNKEEAERLALSLRMHYHGVRGLLRALYQLGVSCVVITDGANGAYAYDGHQLAYHAALPVKLVNTTGAGDAFGSAFLAGYLATSDMQKSIGWGLLNSSSVVAGNGAQHGVLTLPELKQMAKRYGIRP